MDSEIKASVGLEVQSFPLLKLLAELRNCVYEEFLLMSDFNSDMLVFHQYPRQWGYPYSISIWGRIDIDIDILLNIEY